MQQSYHSAATMNGGNYVCDLVLVDINPVLLGVDFSATTITLQICDVATQGTKMVFVAALGFTAAAFWVVCLLSSWSTNVIFMVLVLFTDASLRKCRHDDEDEVNSELAMFTKACQAAYEASKPKVHRTTVERDRYGAYDRLVMAHFSEQPQYDEVVDFQHA
ncbi:hypothetical protein Tco_0308725 [Tanacetum coccineum]